MDLFSRFIISRAEKTLRNLGFVEDKIQMTTITKEWLQQTIAEFENTRDDIPFGLDEDDAKILQALKMVLGGMGQKPVAYADPQAFTNFSIYRDGETESKRMGREWMWANPDAGLIPLYAAPQLSGNSEHVSQPYKLDSWIKCSERMPEDQTVVLVADDRGIVWSAEVQDGQIYPDEFPNAKGFGCAEATHWMSIPEAPQQER